MTTKQLKVLLSKSRCEQDNESNNNSSSVSLLSLRSLRSKQPKEFQKLNKQDQMFVMLDTHGEDCFDSNTTMTVADIEQSRR